MNGCRMMMRAAWHCESVAPIPAETTLQDKTARCFASLCLAPLLAAAAVTRSKDRRFVPRPEAPVLTRPDNAAAQRRKVREMLLRCKRLSDQSGGMPALRSRTPTAELNCTSSFSGSQRGAMSRIFWGSLVGIELRTSPGREPFLCRDWVSAGDMPAPSAARPGEPSRTAQ